MHVRLNIKGSNATEKAKIALFNGVTTEHLSCAHIAISEQSMSGHDNITTFITDLDTKQLTESLGKPFNGAVSLTVNDMPEKTMIKGYNDPIDTEITLEFSE